MKSRMTDLGEAVAVVTGGAGGIGLALAKEVTLRGGKVAIADISLEAARAAAAEVGVGVRAYWCDVTDRASMAQLVDDVVNDFGKVNLVFANAGVAVGGKLHETAPDNFDWLIDVNVRGTFNTVNAFVPALRRQGENGGLARLIFTGSENSVGLPTTGEMTGYTATKHAILAMADGCRRDFKGCGVDVSVLCPGLVATRIYDSKRVRQERYGGAAPLASESAEKMAAMVSQHGQAPEVTARLCIDAIARGEFIVITDPKTRTIARARHSEVEEALNRLDMHLPSSTVLEDCT